MAGIPSLQRQQVMDSATVTGRELTSLQSRVDLVLTEISQTRRPQLSSELIDVDIPLTGGFENAIEHGLGRAPKGWRLVEQSGQADIWHVTNSTTFPASKYLVLASSVDVTVRVEVF